MIVKREATIMDILQVIQTTMDHPTEVIVGSKSDSGVVLGT